MTEKAHCQPMLQRHELPPDEAVLILVVFASAGKNALDAVRADELDLDIAATSMRNPNLGMQSKC